MDIDQLKLILETVTSLGAEGKSAFIWWLVLDKGIQALIWAGFFTVFYRVAMAALTSIRSVNEFCNFRDRLSIGSPGALTNGEITRTVEVISRLIEK